MWPQFHSQGLAIDKRIDTQRKPLGKRCRFLTTPHLVCDGKSVALGTKRAKHANLDMIDSVDGFDLADLEQPLALSLQIVAQRISR